MVKTGGGCHCGNIRIQASFSQYLTAYNPRACDCDFCVKHAAAYVSDPQGSLHVAIRNELEVNRFRQGSETCEMLVCRICGVLVGAVYRESDRLFGTLNVRALDTRANFASEQPVSPKTLSVDQKLQRWRNIWFSDVLLDAASGEQDQAVR
jgi:hypothetical protein